MLKTCIFCSKEFKPRKEYHSVCPECAPEVAKCKTCGKLLKAQDGEFSCCGQTSYVRKPVKPNRFQNKSLDEVVFILNTGQTYQEAMQDVLSEEEGNYDERYD